MWARRVESISGVLGGVLGLAALAVGLFAPLGMSCTATTGGQSSCTAVSIVQMQGLPSLTLVIGNFTVLSLAIALFAVWHSGTRSVLALILLWSDTLLLCVMTLLAILSIGVLFIPADALALLASIAGMVWAFERPQAHA